MIIVRYLVLLLFQKKIQEKLKDKCWHTIKYTKQLVQGAMMSREYELLGDHWANNQLAMDDDDRTYYCIACTKQIEQEQIIECNVLYCASCQLIINQKYKSFTG